MFDGKYLESNTKRIKGIIDFYGHQFIYFKKILDLGCGHADISGALHRLGGDITAVDARQEHLKVASKKYPGIKTTKADLDRGWPFYGKMFDLILDLDLICHLSNFEDHLRAVCASTTHLVIETAVCDSQDPYKIITLPENKAIYDLSTNGVSSRPSAAAIERVLTECGFNFRRQDYNRYNSGSYVYDWVSKNDDSTDINKRRLWFCVKNTSPVQLPQPIIPVSLSSPPPTMGFVPTLQDTKIPITQSYILNSPPKQSTIPTKKIKTALCISGHLRTFLDNYTSVKKHILDKMDCDIFIHTWDVLGMSYRFLDADMHTVKTQDLVDKIEYFYKPKKIIIEPTKQFIVTPLMQSRLYDHRDVPGILSMYYKIEECNKLKQEYEKENNITYECVIRFRGDLYMENPLPVDTYSNLDYLFVPLYGNFGGICDQIAYGSSRIMDIYSTLYSNIEKYLQSGAPMNPEKLLRYHIDANKVAVAKVNLKFLIKRANGLIQDNMLLERALGFIR